MGFSQKLLVDSNLLDHHILVWEMDNQEVLAARNWLEEQIAKVIDSRPRVRSPLWCKVSKQAPRVKFCDGSFKNI